MAMRTEAEARGKMGREPNGQAEYFRFMLRMPQDMARKMDALAKMDYSPMNAHLLRVYRDYLRTHEAEVAEAMRVYYPEAETDKETAPAKRARRVS